MKMKKIILSAVAAIGLSLCNQSVYARSWRINPDPAAKANFTDLNAAVASLEVFNGDTLYLDPGSTFDTKQTLTKGVVVIGTGYGLPDGSIPEATFTGTVYISANNVKMEGCCINSLSANNANYSNFTLERCKIFTISSYLVHDSKIISCLLMKGITGGINYTSGVQIMNSIILGPVTYFKALTLQNNVIVAASGNDNNGLVYKVTNSTITNNIIINTNEGYSVGDDQIPSYYKYFTITSTAPEDDNSINYNVLSSDAAHAFANHPNNKFIGATTADVFTLTGAVDAMYQLKAGSPAAGYGSNGYDCGAFSGPYPYVLSGRPRFIPYIYEAIVPTQPTDGKLNVTLKIRSQNE